MANAGSTPAVSFLKLIYVKLSPIFLIDILGTTIESASRVGQVPDFCILDGLFIAAHLTSSVIVHTVLFVYIRE